MTAEPQETIEISRDSAQELVRTIDALIQAKRDVKRLQLENQALREMLTWKPNPETSN